jgi:hypothetical protein
VGSAISSTVPRRGIFVVILVAVRKALYRLYYYYYFLHRYARRCAGITSTVLKAREWGAGRSGPIVNVTNK